MAESADGFTCTYRTYIQFVKHHFIALPHTIQQPFFAVTIMKAHVGIAFAIFLSGGSCRAFTGSVPPPVGVASSCSLSAAVKTYEGDLDTEALLAKSTFPIKPLDLIDLAKQVAIEKGIGTKDGGECLAEDFTFRAQFVEVDKPTLIKTLGSFNLEDSFDLKQQFFGWNVDPLQSNRVWFMNRQEATHVKDFAGVKPEGKHLVLPPQSYHIDFNEDGKVKEFGFYTVDRAQGNTGGLGGAFGFFYGVGRPLPFPEGKPYKMSFRRRVLEFVANLASKLQKK